jgi:hypothetical protein
MSSADHKSQPYTFTQFTEEQWKAILAIRANWPAGIDWLKVRHELEGAGRGYWWLHEQRRLFGIPSTVQKELKALLQQLRKLQAGLKSLPRWVTNEIPADITPLEPWLQDLLKRYKRLAEIERYGFAGRRDNYRDILHEQLFEKWCDTLGGELSYARDAYEVPCGPLIEFLGITLTAILGQAPGPSGLAKIIDEYR